jgi:hypothetical protein
MHSKQHRNEGVKEKQRMEAMKSMFGNAVAVVFLKN